MHNSIKNIVYIIPTLEKEEIICFNINFNYCLTAVLFKQARLAVMLVKIFLISK